jgi:SnoaL-like protein
MAATTSLDACGIVTAAVEALNARRLDDLLPLLCADVEIRPLRPTARSVYRGPAGIALLLSELSRQRRDERIVITRTRIVSDRRVVAIGHLQAGSEQPAFAGFHELRDGLISRMHHYFSDEALLQRIGRIG